MQFSSKAITEVVVLYVIGAICHKWIKRDSNPYLRSSRSGTFVLPRLFRLGYAIDPDNAG